MKGRSPWNKTSVRKKDVYGLLLKFGGEARWKDLKANLKELGWGPTTLKQTLDQMVGEGSVVKEARLGEKGPEAWYRVQIKDGDIWEPLERAIAEEKETLPSMAEIADAIRKRLQLLEDKEREAFLRTEIRKIIDMARDVCAALFYMQARGAKKMGKEESLSVFDYIFDLAFKKQIKEYIEICMEYPEHTMVVVDSLLARLSLKESEQRLRNLKEI